MEDQSAKINAAASSDVTNEDVATWGEEKLYYVEQEPSLLQKIAEWDFDMAVVYDWFANTANYWGDKYGFIAYLAVAGVVVLALLAFPITSRFTGLLVASGIRALTSAFTLVFAGGFLWLLNTLKDMTIARTRAVVKAIKAAGKNE